MALANVCNFKIKKTISWKSSCSLLAPLFSLCAYFCGLYFHPWSAAAVMRLCSFLPSPLGLVITVRYPSLSPPSVCAVLQLSVADGATLRYSGYLLVLTRLFPWPGIPPPPPSVYHISLQLLFFNSWWPANSPHTLEISQTQTLGLRLFQLTQCCIWSALWVMSSSTELVLEPWCSNTAKMGAKPQE